MRQRSRTFAAFLLSTLGFSCVDDLRPVSPPGKTAPVERLSELGIFVGSPAHYALRADFVPYEVNVPLYADGAEKRRAVYLPPGARIHATDDRWEIPVGAYLVKTFSFPLDLRDPSLGERFVETRFLVRTEGGFVASTYLWNEEQTDAFASQGDLDVAVTFVDRDGRRQDRSFHVPSARDCAGCHAGRALGWRSRQLDHEHQIERFLELGLIDAVPADHAVLHDPFGNAPLDMRARSYLDANCGHCHGEGGSAERTGVLWELENTGLMELPLCRRTRSVDGRDRVIVPGHPEGSEFLARLTTSNLRWRMPRGPSRVTDQAGFELLSAWVDAMPASFCDR
jgi:uncharacterized repeat protein (TIGR03806 family)